MKFNLINFTHHKKTMIYCSIRIKINKIKCGLVKLSKLYHLMFMEFENVIMYISVAPVNIPTFCSNSPKYAEFLFSSRFSSIIDFISGVYRKNKIK